MTSNMADNHLKSHLVVTGTTFLLFCALQVTLRLLWQTELSFLNEDPGLILNAVQSLHEHGPLHWFYNGYGPSILRPWQMLWMGLIGSISYSPIVFATAEIALLAAGQTLLFVTLKNHFGFYGAFTTALIPSLSRASAESIYWLSAGHDLFLLLFSALALYYVRRSLPLCLLSVWCAFFSNEKSVALPVVLACYAVALYLKENSLRSQRKTLFRTLFSLLGMIPAYFLYRRWVLNSYIGGYTDKLFSSDFFTLSSLSSWILSTFTAPFWQPKGGEFFFVIGVLGFLLLAGATLRFNRRQALSCLLLWIISHLAFTLPTAQFALPYMHNAIFSTRMYWTAVLSISFLIGGMVGRLLARRQYFFTFIGIAFIILSTSVSTFSTLTSFSRASSYTKRALSLFRNHCDCAAPTDPQSSGLPLHVATVNTFTEASWLDYHALISGLPKCNGNGSCNVDFIANEKHPRLIPIKTSPGLISLPEEKSSSQALSSCFQVKRRDIKRKNFHLLQWTITLQDGAKTECQDFKRFVVLINGNPQLQTELELRKPKLVANQNVRSRRSKAGRFCSLYDQFLLSLWGYSGHNAKCPQPGIVNRVQNKTENNTVRAIFRLKTELFSPEIHSGELYTVREEESALIGQFEFMGNGVSSQDLQS